MEKQQLMRLDQYLVEYENVRSRTMGQDLIRRGFVTVNGVVAKRASQLIGPGQQVKIISSMPYVSRAGEKLAEANEALRINFARKTVLDIGASTGGFTDYALQNGADRVYALDVGHHQLDHRLRDDPRVVNLEGTNLKEIPTLEFPPLDVILCDVSFIGLEHVFPAIDALVQRDRPVVAFLIKPQFENRFVKIKKFRGKVPTKFLEEIVASVAQVAAGYGYHLKRLIPLTIRGKKLHNEEFFGLFSRI